MPQYSQRLMSELPASIRKDLQESLDRERVVLRFDAINRCAYYITREKNALIVWLWCELRARAAGHLLAAIVAANEPMNERLALELYDELRSLRRLHVGQRKRPYIRSLGNDPIGRPVAVAAGDFDANQCRLVAALSGL